MNAMKIKFNHMNAMKIRFKKLCADAKIPTFGNDDTTNAGMDFYSIHDYTIRAGGHCVVDTGIAWDGIPLCTPYEKPVLIIKSRSGLAFNKNIEASNAGVVDASYQGAIKVKLYNKGRVDYVVKKGERIAQGIVYMIPNVHPIEIEEFSSETERGDKGFGSTGE